eukprot:7387960-Prymnesium_polylepis.2
MPPAARCRCRPLLPGANTSPPTDVAVPRHPLCAQVPALRNALPFDPAWQFSDIFLHRTITSCSEYDSITRQGASNVVEKVKKVGAEACLRVSRQYYDSGQTWWQQLEDMVGEGYDQLPPEA